MESLKAYVAMIVPAIKVSEDCHCGAFELKYKCYFLCILTPCPLHSVVQCQLPPPVQNGAHSNQETAVFTRGMPVKYTCEPGYTLTGEATIYCSDSGTWSPAPPQCEASSIDSTFTGCQFLSPGTFEVPVECYHVTSFLKAEQAQFFQHLITRLIFQALYHLCCPPLNSLQIIIILFKPECPKRFKHCNNFFKQSMRNSLPWKRRETFQNWCRQGYMRNSLTWSAMQCPLPPRIVHGKFVGEDFRYKQSAIYICDAGYSLVGEHNITCILESSNSVKWSEPPKCKGCPAPPKIGNGTHDQKGLEDFPYGSSVTYLCDPGYILIGSATIHCLSSGVWDGPVPKCKHGESVIFAVAPEAEIGSQLHSFRSANFHGFPHGVCKKGPSMRRIAGCVTPEVQNGRVMLSEEEGTITIQCNPGCILKGNHTIQCTLDGTWDSPLPTCVGDVQCQPPPFIQNGGHSSQQAAVFTRGMVVTYTCDSGYNLTGEKTIYCTDLGTWSFPAPRCEVVQCQLPPPVQNGAHSNQGTAVFTRGMSVKYACEPGYTLTGEATIYCSDFGTWSPAPPRCAVMHCPLPSRITHGKYIGEDFRYGQSVIYICDAGYSLVGEHSVTCILEGSNSVRWSELPKCKEKQEGFRKGRPLIIHKIIVELEGVMEAIKSNPPAVAGHHITPAHSDGCPVSGIVLFFLSSYRYTLQMVGSSFIYLNAVFDLLSRCPAPPEISNGKNDGKTLEDFPYGSFVTYHCEPGYILTGATTMHCLSSGTWDGLVPQCTRSKCMWQHVYFCQVKREEKEEEQLILPLCFLQQAAISSNMTTH
ncbi:Complement receptor type 2 [Varanus komodoensis]|nr:Complement receptor type 2 [Varanus komodoensis]